MDAGDWFVQLHRAGKPDPEPPIYFADFAATISHVRSNIPLAGDCLRVHVPARATEAERQELIDAGAVPGI
jgi:hypothetical protein